MITGVHHFSFSVTDMDRTVEFYTKLLGVRLQSRGRNTYASLGAALFGTNITDERGIQSMLSFLNLFGTVETTYVRPEEWALSIQKHF